MNDVQLQIVLNVVSKATKLGYLIDFNGFNMTKCLEKSINIGSCGRGSESKKSMLISDNNEPILKLLIDGELSEQELLDLKDKTSVEKHLET